MCLRHIVKWNIVLQAGVYVLKSAGGVARGYCSTVSSAASGMSSSSETGIFLVLLMFV